MIPVEKLAGVRIYEALCVRLTDFDHLCRDRAERAVAAPIEFEPPRHTGNRTVRRMVIPIL
jgi:hypothetical protein